MKLMTNFFQGKKPSHEEGQMIYQIEKDDFVVNHVEGNRNRKRCVKIMKVIFYIVLVLFILFLGWIGLVFLALEMSLTSPRGVCGTSFLPDYQELIKDGMLDNPAINANNMSDEDYRLPSWGDDGLTKFMETDTSTISNPSESRDFDVEMIPSATQSVDEALNENVQNLDTVDPFLRLYYLEALAESNIPYEEYWPTIKSLDSTEHGTKRPLKII